MPTKVDSSRSGGRAKPVYLDGPDIRIYGYWLGKKQDVRVDVPVLDHGYYPRIDHPDSMVRKNVVKRKITMPSETALRNNGYDVDRAILISEIMVHPRHEKNLNYFRSEFPALMKTLARREKIMFVLPANDIPSAKIKRKQALNLWRSAFTPLLLKGKQYTSGRMGFFVIPPNPEAITRLKRSLHLEGAEELVEYTPGAQTTTRKRRKYLTRRYDAIKARRQVNRHLDQIADEIADRITDDLDSQLTPMINTRLTLPPDARKDVDTILDDPEAGKALLKEYKRTHYNSRSAATRWVKKWLVPRLKTMLREHGEEVLRKLGSAAFQIITALAVNAILSKIGASSSLPGWAKDAVSVTSVPHSFNVAGATNVTVTPKMTTPPRDADDQLFLWAASQTERRFGYDESYAFKQLLQVVKDSKSPTGHHFEVDWREHSKRSKGELGRFKDAGVLKRHLKNLNTLMVTQWNQRKLFTGGQAFDYGF